VLGGEYSAKIRAKEGLSHRLKPVATHEMVGGRERDSLAFSFCSQFQKMCAIIL